LENGRFNVLDGWRGISILLVLATHLLPLGPHAWQLNVTAGIMGMVFFFILSGFLVTHFLLTRYGVVDFLIRRFFRILPLVWLYMTLMFLISPVTREIWIAHFLFYVNYPPDKFIPTTPHLWSVCVELHFYLGIALLVAFFNKRGLLLIPVLLIAVTLLRATLGVHYSIMTHLRIDEILAGAMLALVYNGKLPDMLRALMRRASLSVTFILLLISCHPDAGFMCYLRPYFAMVLVGATLFNHNTAIDGVLRNKVLLYIATISFALYVIHPFLAATWLGSGGDLEKYAKRPLLLAVLLISAHVSTFYYEQRWIALGKRISSKLRVGGTYELK
jgi:peptidoglycan/LPS O-acetylase OafA/YrhL